MRMGETLGTSPDDDPNYELGTLTGPELDAHLLGLQFQSVKVLSLGGFRIICIDSRFVNPETNIVTVECRDEELHPHRLSYTLEDGSQVAHEMLKDRPNPRAKYY